MLWVAWFFGHPRKVLVSGKTVAYWLDQAPLRRDGDTLLSKGNPLTRAGPEIIPDLLAAIQRSYATREVIKRYSGFIPAWLHNALGVNRPTASQIHGYAAYQLGLMGPAASNAVPTILELLKFHSKYRFDGERVRIIQALGNIGPPASQAAPSLVRELQNPTDWVKRTTARAFLQMGTVPSEAIPFLKENLSVMKEGPGVTAVALLAAEENQENISRVALMLTTETHTRSDLEIRVDAAASLMYLKNLPAQLKPILFRMLDEDDARVLEAAAIGLARPNDENLSRVVAVLTEGLKSPRWGYRCAEALGRIGPQAAIAIPDLQSVNGYVLWNVAQVALGRIDQPDGAANRSQPVSPQTGRTRAAAGSGR